MADDDARRGKLLRHAEAKLRQWEETHPRRVVLVKPGDVLLIGNAPSAVACGSEAAAEFFDRVGIAVALFGDDIDVDVYRAEAQGGA